MNSTFQTTVRYCKLIDRNSQKVIGLIAYRYTNHFTVLEYGLSIVHPDEQYNFEVGSKYALERLEKKDPKFYVSIEIDTALNFCFYEHQIQTVKPKFTSLSRMVIEALVADTAEPKFNYPVHIRFTHRHHNRG